jgi:ABC-2 type transport system ATP-binding protein
MIRVTELRKRYGATKAVDGVSFEIERGESFGLLGPNGAGKTTTLHLLVGALAPDAGSIEIDGEPDPRRPAVRRGLGLAPQSLALYDELTAAENLAFFGRLYGLAGKRLHERVEWALSLAGLGERRQHRAKTFSGGMKRRLNLACALGLEFSGLELRRPTLESVFLHLTGRSLRDE